ncbi:hypothetical protein BKA62DRAFT_692432 [Auriculariales sp. MPI-PUGE-AT-0066]|nr:hypothetical protein BKA62DRAFT_692432 [Auriculariales sp. MPI-PUGE-AT-0066]
MDVNSFREHVGSKHEVITISTKLKSTNKGFALLMKMGWKEGSGLGLSDDARVDPVPFVLKSDSTGIGKAAMDARVIEATVAQRRDLDSERQAKESEEQLQARRNAAVQKQVVQTGIAQVLRPFYCDVCDKQYQTVSQYDEHCNSYAHAHKKRFRDMQAAERAKNASSAEAEARKEKERKREQKELRKMAKAAGVKLPAGAGTGPSETPSGFKKAGWASVSSTVIAAEHGAATSEASTTLQQSSNSTSSGFKRAGWSTMGSLVTPVATISAEQSDAKLTTTPGAPSIPTTGSGFKKIGISLVPSTEQNAISTPLHHQNQWPGTSAAAGPSARKGNAEQSRSNWSSFQRGAPVQSRPVVPANDGAATLRTATSSSTQQQGDGVKRGRSRSRTRSPPARGRPPSGSRSPSRSRSPRSYRRRRRHSSSRSRSRSLSRSRSRSPPRRHRLPGSSSSSAYPRPYENRDRDGGSNRRDDRYSNGGRSSYRDEPHRR